MLEVRQSHIVKDSMKEARKSKFDPTKQAKASNNGVLLLKYIDLDLSIQVRFIGEGAVDHGGPRREFFCLLAIGAKDFFLVGPPAKKFFAANVSAIQVGRSKYFRLSEVTPNPLTQMKDLYNLGRYIAMSVAQGGSGFPFLAEPVYKYLCTGECTGIQLSNEDAPDPTLKFVLEKVSDLKSKHKQFHSRPEEVLFVYTALLRHVIYFFIPGCMT